MVAVLQYLWSIQIKIGDLNLPYELTQKLSIAGKGDNSKIISELESYFLHASPAHSLPPIPVSKRPGGKDGDPEKGKYIYEMSCMKCHSSGRTTNYVLDQSILSVKMLAKYLYRYARRSVYNIVRNVTFPRLSYKPYMPFYTKERMSDSQIEDLAAYINQRTEKNKKLSYRYFYF